MTYSSFRDSVKQKFGDQWLVPLAYIMVKSILHDLPEAALSDIPHDAKRILKSVVPGFARALDDLEESFFQRALIRDMLSNVDSVLSKVVKLSDIISVYVYTDNEGKLGNHTLSDISDDARTRIISLRDDFPEGFIDSLFTSTDWSL
jgi:5'-deoxynucleotidase YfbR-like HD superfamily hydrolase